MSLFTIQIITLSGSLLSMFGSGLMIVCCILLPITGTFRHQLICSLAISDFIYSLNNTISGFLLVNNGSINVGTFCTINGYIHHYTSLTRDLTVLGIALVTYSVLKGSLDSASYEPYLPRQRIAIFAFIWLAPNISAIIGYKSSGFVVASGNWCSAPSDPVWVRGVLFLGIPFAIIISIIVLYSYLYSSLRIYYKTTRQLDTGYFDEQRLDSESLSGNYDERQSTDAIDEVQFRKSMVLSCCVEKNVDHLTVINIQINESPEDNTTANMHLNHKDMDAIKSKPRFSMENNDHITMAMRRIYLYPLVYVAISLPGLLARLIETLGVTMSIFGILQSITQLTGLANAVLYGFTGTVRRALYDQYIRSINT